MSRTLDRLLAIRQLEERQSRLELESALAEMRRIEKALEFAAERDRGGRCAVMQSAGNGRIDDRLAGLVEIEAAGCHRMALAPRQTQAGQKTAALRVEFLARRVERRQAETLIEEAQVRHAQEADRRGQQGLDDWYGLRCYRETQRLAATGSRGSSGSTREGKE